MPLLLYNSNEFTRVIPLIFLNTPTHISNILANKIISASCPQPVPWIRFIAANRSLIGTILDLMSSSKLLHIYLASTKRKFPI